jgi:hypothetical protein
MAPRFERSLKFAIPRLIKIPARYPPHCLNRANPNLGIDSPPFALKILEILTIGFAEGLKFFEAIPGYNSPPSALESGFRYEIIAITLDAINPRRESKFREMRKELPLDDIRPIRMGHKKEAGLRGGVYDRPSRSRHLGPVPFKIKS